MAKAPSLPTITGSYASSTQLNAAFRAIEDSFENTLSLDGSTPNSMLADLDMNSNDILNANIVHTDTLILNGTAISDTVESQFKFATRAALVAAIAAGLVPEGGIIYEADGVQYLGSTGATAIADLPGLVPNGIMTPQHFGDITYGGNATAAFTVMFAYYETLTDISLAPAGGFRNTVFGRNAAHKIRIPAGRYVLDTGWLPNSNAGRNIVIEGDGQDNTMIVMPTDGTASYLVEYLDRTDGGTAYQNVYHSVAISGLTLVGGKGLYMNSEPDAPFVQRGLAIEDVAVVAFTECAIGSLWGDDPRWTLRKVRIETTRPNTKGIYAPRGIAQPSFTDVSIIGCTYKVVTAPAFQSLSVFSGITCFSLSDDDHEADIWFKTIDNADPNDGRGVIVTGCRFSNENRDGKPIILIADGDGAGGEIAERHSTSVSTRRFIDWSFRNNVASGSGTADVAPGGPMVASYANLGGADISNNIINAGFSHLLWLAADPVGNRSHNLRIGPNKTTGLGEAAQPCNRLVGQWINENGVELPGASTALPSDGATDPDYQLVGVTAANARISMGLVTSSSATLVSSGFLDAYGFTDSRAVIFTDAAGYIEASADATQLAAMSLRAGDNYFVEWDAKTTGASLQLTEVDVEIVATMPGGTLTRVFSYRPTEGWRRNRIAFTLNEKPTALIIRWKPSPDNWSVSSDRTQIARPYIYRANRPQINVPVKVPNIQKALLLAGSAAVIGTIIYVPDEAGGATLAFSDGTNWRRVTDRAIVS